MVPVPTLRTQATPALSTQWLLAQICPWLAQQQMLLLLLPAQMPRRQHFPLSQEVARLVLTLYHKPTNCQEKRFVAQKTAHLISLPPKIFQVPVYAVFNLYQKSS